MIDLGDVATLGVEIRDAAAALANATAVVCTITLPDGTSTAPAVTPTSTGLYSVAFTPSQVGLHLVRWVATGTNASVNNEAFTVTTAPGIISLAEAKAFLNITTTTSDAEIRDHILTATKAAELWTGRILEPATVVESFDGGTAKLFLTSPAATSITTVVESGTTLAASSYRLDKSGQYVERISGTTAWCWASGIDTVAITYRAGVAGNQLAVAVHAIKQMLLHLWQTQRGARRNQFNAEDTWNPGMGYSFPTRVLQLLEPLKIAGFA